MPYWPSPQERHLKFLLGFAIAILSLFVLIFVFNRFTEINSLKFSQTKKVEPPPIGAFKVTAPEVLYSFDGDVREKNSDLLVLLAHIPQIDSEGKIQILSEMRRVLIGVQTRFSKLSIVTDNQRQVIKESRISLADIKVGDAVEVIANFDITNQPEFEASQVRIRPLAF